MSSSQGTVVLGKNVRLRLRTFFRKGRGFASPSRHHFCGNGPKKKPREKSSRIDSSRIVNERERADVGIRLTGCKVDSEGGMQIGNGYEKGFRFELAIRLNGERRLQD